MNKLFVAAQLLTGPTPDTEALYQCYGGSHDGCDFNTILPLSLRLAWGAVFLLAGCVGLSRGVNGRAVAVIVIGWCFCALGWVIVLPP